ncbi:hypothetical protein B0H16DRAFT_1740943 [Mycena metata]|uniref:Uncharacterized protein n=1 Tax=Mycena metata TaxID=1033252 RepID=A0AAD7MHA3_9AGAR|nr:hypothetical protein B0H16DRAFT_1740943 [Mycena metata]
MLARTFYSSTQWQTPRRYAELADAIGVRLGYRTRHLLDSATAVDAIVPTDRPSTLASTCRGVTEPCCLPDSKTLPVAHVPTSTFIPVHADRGPDAARNAPTYDEFLTTTTTTEALGQYREVVGTLVFGHPEDSSIVKRKFPLVFDLGSNDLWVYGQDLQTTGACPKGIPGHPPLFWFQRGKASERVSDALHTAKYADGSSASGATTSIFVHDLREILGRFLMRFIPLLSERMMSPHNEYKRKLQTLFNDCCLDGLHTRRAYSK